MKKISYILVACSGSAKIFKHYPIKNTLEMVELIANPDGRKHSGDLDSDRPGVQKSDIGGFHSFAGDDNSHKRQVDGFARFLCVKLAEALEAKKFDNLMIAATPHFLGDLRHHLNHACNIVLSKTVDKNLLQCPGSEILAYFA